MPRIANKYFCRAIFSPLSDERHLERRAIFRRSLAVIVDARRGNIGVPQPFLHFDDIGAITERVGGTGRADCLS